MYFSKLICQFLWICFQVHMSKISDKSDKFLLNYSKLFWVHFSSGHSVLTITGCN